MRRHLADLLIASCFAAVVAFVLPLQTYLANADLYAFSAARAIVELLALSVGFGAVAFLLLFFFGRFLGGVLQAFFVAATVCVYLECGVLSLGLPELNGGTVALLADKGRCVFDACVWGVVVVTFLATARWTRTWLPWVAAAVLLLAVAALFDIRRPSASERTSNGTGFANQMTVVANVRYSPARNILVFVLDSMPGKVAVDVIANDPELRSKLRGFTAYPRNIGMHECTKRGVPGLVTGRHYDPLEMSEADYPMTMYGTNSFVTVARDLGWNVAFSPDLLPYGYTNLPIEKRVEREEKRRSRDKIAFLRQSKEVPFLSLFDTVAFRYSPFFFKGPILYSRIRHAVKGRHSADAFWSERTMYPQLAARPVAADAKPFLGFFHSWGAHPPWETDFRTMVADRMRTFGELLDAYRRQGVLDRSLIVVTSDHGLDQVPPPEGYPPSASAFLLVKPFGATAPFAVSDLPTSHARIAPLVKAALEAPVSDSRCGEILRDDQPLYRAEVREGGRESFRTWGR